MIRPPRLTRFILLLATLSTPASVAEERYPFVSYTVADGLAQSQVLSVHQDRRGFLWVGTAGGGVSRFDGAEFVTFTRSDGLTGNVVSAIAERDDSALLFGTDGGVSLYDGGRFRRMDLGDPWNRVPVHSILSESSGSVWIGTERGVLRIVAGASGAVPLEGFPARPVNVIRRGRDGDLWIGGSGSGLARYDGRQLTRFGRRDGLPGEEVYALGEDGGGRLWVGTENGACGVEVQGDRVSFSPPVLPRNPVRAIISTRDGGFWLGTDGLGACRMQGETPHCVDVEPTIAADTVYTLTEDREGNLWVGTYRAGLKRYAGEMFASQAGLGPFDRDIIRALHQDPDGNIWIGAYRSGLARWDGRSLRRFTAADGLADDFVLTIAAAGRDLWIGTLRGASRFDGRAFHNLTTADGLPDGFIRAICQGQDGRVWLGTNSEGIAIVDGSRIERLDDRQGLSSNRVLTLLNGRRGIWIGTDRGVDLSDGGKIVDFSSAARLPREEIYSLLEDADGNLWIAAFARGIIFCSASAVDAALAGRPVAASDVGEVTRNEGLLNGNVVSLAMDSAGQLWIGMEGAVSRLDAAAYARSRTPHISTYGRADGFLGDECTQGAILRDRAGNVWFGTVAGLQKCSVERHRPNAVEPATHITRVLLFNGEEDIGRFAAGTAGPGGLPQRLRLPHEKSHVTFEYTGISLTVPGKVRYRYMLEGLDREWSPPTTRRSVTYPSLGAGRYRFLVEACNNDGIWNAEPATFGFEVRPLFWQATWFLVVVACTGLLGVYGLVRARVWSLERRGRRLETEVANRTRELAEEKAKIERMNLELEERVAARTADLTAGQAALLESERKYRDLVEHANDVILRWDRSGTILFVNPRGLKLFGCGADELIGRNIVGTIVPQEDTGVPGGLPDLVNSAEGDPARYRNLESQHSKADGKPVWISWNNRVSRDETGRPVEILSIGIDITERKLLEAQLFQSKKMEAIGTLAGGIAHDFNNLLMVVQGNASLMLSSLGAGDPLNARIRAIEDAVSSGTQLTRQLLGFARGGRYEVKPTDLGELVTRTAALFGRAKRDLAVHHEIPAGLWAVDADRGQMEQVMMNLYVNAWQAMPDGGEIRIAMENVFVDDRDRLTFTVKPGRYVAVSVTDTGVGMDEPTKQRIFEPFFTTREMGRGTGLGLATVYGIVKAHGGFIKVYSEIGRGSTFKVFLPASAHVPAEESCAPPDIRRGRGTVLLVDDEALIRDVAGSLLRELGYDVIEAAGGLDALQLFADNRGRIDVVLLDMIMPHMGGGEVFDRLRAIDPDVRVLLSSGYSIDSRAREILARGCDGFIPKPFNLNELSLKLREVLEVSKA